MKRTFTKYPSDYVKADSEYKKRIYVYYTSNTTSNYKENLLNAWADESLEKYGAEANFGYYNSKCRSYGKDAGLCIISTKKPISKAKIKSVFENDLDIGVYDIIIQDFETSFI